MSDDAAVAAPRRPLNVFTIPPHRAFADALVAGILAQHGGDPLILARGLILLPTNRAVRAVTDAFVRQAQGGLLLPRLAAIGDPEAADDLGPAIGGGDLDSPLPPAVDPLRRLMILARLVSQVRPVGTVEAVRLARELARTLDQLLIERIPPAALAAAVSVDLAHHWQVSLEQLQVVLDRWPRALAAIGCIDLADRRNRLLDALGARWKAAPPAGFVVAAGIDTTAPAVAGLLRRIARMERGQVVFAGLDQHLDPRVWDLIGPHDPDPATGRRRPSIETHPQFHLKLLLDRMGVARGEVRRWRWAGARTAPSARSRSLSHAMLPAAATAAWQTLPPSERRLSGIRAAEFATPGEEAQAIAIAIREAVAVPARTVALVTPDRALARRVAAHLDRWGIAANDSAGAPLSISPAGTFLLALAELAVGRFAPVQLLAVLKHPLVARGEERLAWLEGVRRLDAALRGPRPPAGLDGLAGFLASETDARGAHVRAAARGWWREEAHRLAAVDAAFRDGRTLPALLAGLRDSAEALCGDAIWAGEAGRALADLLTDLDLAASEGPAEVLPEALPGVLRVLMDDVAVRPARGGHPRVAILGLIEARLQRADVTILGGLNEGVWPGAPAPDPWLAPGQRIALGLAGLERRIGLAAHDFVTALGAPEVLVTRARRDASAPTIASRFWLRLDAMTGGVTRHPTLARWARAIDRPAGPPRPVDRPAPTPPLAARPTRIAVTAVDRLKADPFAFYARSILKLPSWEAIDADPGPAWRGTMVHRVLELWLKEDRCRPDRLLPRIEAMLGEGDTHVLLRALWQPRLTAAIEWIAATIAANRAEGREPIAAEIKGEVVLAGVTLEGTADRIDRLADGSLAIVDYKTGQPPSTAAVAAGFAMQLGLLGAIAARGGFPGLAGEPAAFEYWSLARNRQDGFGTVASPVGGKGGIDPADFPDRAAGVFAEAVVRWLAGEAPFTAKLHPQFAPYGDYDHLMRLEEWYGRQAPVGSAAMT
jgi:ATP-dependent helicase/nuclease subunit B